MEFWDNWVALGLFAAGAWALSGVIDVCFVGEGIYREPVDGPVIAGLFCLVPALSAAPAAIGSDVSWQVIGLGTLSSVAYLLRVYFYFKALFELNDASNAEIFNTLSVLIVPVLAFVVLGERMNWVHYLAIGVAGVGVLILVAMQSSRITRSALGNLTISVAAVSLSMVLQASVLKHADYGTAVGVFSGSAFLIVFAYLATRPKKRKRITVLCRRFGAIFVAVQLLELGAVFGSHRATDLSPSVSMVALLECTLPIFIMLFSWLTMIMLRRWPATDTTAIRLSLSTQTAAAPSKLAAMTLIIAAVAISQA